MLSFSMYTEFTKSKKEVEMIKPALSNALCTVKDVVDNAWIKTAVLFWDSINIIVSNSEFNHEMPYYKYNPDYPDLKYLTEIGFLKPVHLDSSKLIFEPFDYIDSEELFNSFFTTILPWEGNKPLNDEWKYHIGRKCHSLGLHFDESFNYYVMGDFVIFRSALHENKICESHSLAPVSSNLMSIKYYNLIRRGRNLSQQGNSEQGLMFDMAINDLNIIPICEMKKIIGFKEKHKDELGPFRTQIARLTQNIEQNQPFEAILENVNNAYKNDFLPAYNNFKKALKAYGIKWFSDNLFKVFTMSVGSMSIPKMIGASEQEVLLFGVGITLTASRIAYSTDKQKILRQNPYSYLLSIEKKYHSKIKK